MSVQLTAGGVGAAVAVVAVAGLGLYLYTQRKALANAGQEAFQYVNPISDKNIFYQGASAPFAGSLGARLWEWTSPIQVQAEREAQGYAPVPDYAMQQSPAWGII